MGCVIIDHDRVHITTRLHTGYGAIYHHVADRSALLAAVTDDVIALVLTGVVVDADPPEALRRLALGLFDAIDAHPLGRR